MVVGKEAVSMSKRPAGIICLGPILLSVLTFIDGAEFKAISSDLAIVQSRVDCHNHHPRATRQIAMGCHGWNRRAA